MTRTDANLKDWEKKKWNFLNIYISFIAFWKCKQEVDTFGHEQAEREFYLLCLPCTKITMHNNQCWC